MDTAKRKLVSQQVFVDVDLEKVARIYQDQNF